MHHYIQFIVGVPIYCNQSGTRELIDHVLNDRENAYACHFLRRVDQSLHDLRDQAARLPRVDCNEYEPLRNTRYGTQYDPGSEPLAPFIASASPW